MEAKNGNFFSQLAEKVLPHPIRPSLISICPTMELVAVVTEDEQVDVYRFGGQRAFSLPRRRLESTIRSLRWKFNGVYLAVGWQDGSVDVLASATGSVVQSLSHTTSSPHEAPVACIGWSMHFIDVPAFKQEITAQASSKAPKAQPESLQTTEDWDRKTSRVSLEQFLDREPNWETLDIEADLPNILANMDIQAELPKLRPLPLLPAGSAYKPTISAELFASQSTLDSVLAVSQREHYALGVLLPCHEDLSIRPVFFDCLQIGTIKLPHQWNFKTAKPVGHGSHPFSCSELLLAEVPPAVQGGDSKHRLAIIPLTLRFMQTSGGNLHITTSRTAHLKYMLDYITGAVDSIAHHFNTSQDLPSKFIRNAEEDLKEKGQGTFVQMLYHLAATGNCPPTIKEWLVDQLAERGHKRWDHSVAHGYLKVIELTHRNLLPAIDRCSVLVTSLRGLAKFHEDDNVFSVSPDLFTKVLEVLKCLRLLAHNVLVYTQDERHQFTQFSKWLRHEIDVQAMDPDSASAEETLERDLSLDTMQLLAYIDGALTQSKLRAFLSDEATVAPATKPSTCSYEETKKQADRFDHGAALEPETLKIRTHCSSLRQCCEKVFSEISAFQVANTSMNCGLVIEDEETSVTDIRMIDEQLEISNSLTTYVLCVPSSANNEIRLHRIVHAEIFDGIKDGVHANESITIHLPPGEIKDAKFVDDEDLVIIFTITGNDLLQDQDNIHNAADSCTEATNILRISYRGDSLPSLPSAPAPPSRPRDPFILHYHPRNSKPTTSTTPNLTPLASMELPHGTAGTNSALLDLSSSDHNSPFKRFLMASFATSQRFKPFRLDVVGREGARKIVLLGEDLRHYRVFGMDLDGDEGGGGEVEDGSRSNGERDQGDVVMSG
ncbi:hypothetical protein K402DRAFT_463704 [Aulographum hederae CBS 113979]|uniref:Anaphase-promoting complex subunit 4 n=1 Tax=Aulographum hederae CBS 113979 TaxID=1176131 RepID=A0A6G1H036_9PEZI|nr:hypothetical protein K402DRAFT_463704 [Aulographum hederae CBS 113979]